MRENFPSPITDEKDLDFYQNYLKREFETTAPNTLHRKLKTLIGSLVKAECLLGNQHQIKIGYLLEVGEDFITLKQPQSNAKTIIRTDTVKLLHILKDAQKNYTYGNSTIYTKQCQ